MDPRRAGRLTWMVRLAALAALLAVGGQAVAQSGVRARMPTGGGASAAAKLGAATSGGVSRGIGGTRGFSGRAVGARGGASSAGASALRFTPGRGGGFVIAGGGSAVAVDADFGSARASLRLGGGAVVLPLRGGVGVVSGGLHGPTVIHRGGAHGHFVPHGLHFGGHFGGHGRFYDEPTRRRVIDGPPVIIIDRTGAVTTNTPGQNEPVASAPPPPPPLEVGLRALADGRWEEAIEALREHVGRESDDYRAQRLLALALLGEGRLELGAAVLASAYRADPSLAGEPLERELVGSLSRWRAVQRSAQRWGASRRTASGWLASIVLTQAELAPQVLRERLVRAEAAGLPTAIVDALDAYLGAREAREGVAGG